MRLKNRHLLLITILTFLVIVLLKSNVISKNSLKYLGAKSCRKCHGLSAIGNQYRKWQRSPHAKAFIILKEKLAKDIAKKHFIDKPSESLKCLKCHSTGYGIVNKINREGVGCEACHGPSSEYIDMENHVNYLDKNIAYKKAISHGMYPILTDNHLKKREILCNRCHNKKRLCYNKEATDEMGKLPIQIIDSMRKGNLDLSHPLHR